MPELGLRQAIPTSERLFMKMDRYRLNRILVAADGSEESMDAARYAAELVRRLNVSATLLHVAPTPTISLEAARSHSENIVEIEKTMWESAQVILDRCREPFDQAGVSVEGVIRRGEAAEEILKLAQEEDYDLIVVASRGVGSAERTFLGSTSDTVVRSAPCPVLVVRR